MEHRPPTVHRVAERLVERVDRTVPLARTEPPFAVDLDGDGRLRPRPLLVGSAAHADAEVQGTERLIVRVEQSGAAPQEQFERGVGRLEFESFAFEGFDALKNLADARVALGERVAERLGLRALRRLLEEVTNLSDPVRAEANRKLLEELVPEKVPVDLLLSVLRLLLEERVSIRNLPLILEAIAEARGYGNPEAICEHVRQRLGFQLVAEIRRGDGTIPLLQLAPEWEDTFRAFQIEGERGQTDVALPPDKFNRLAVAVAEKVARAGEQGIFPALVTSARRRRFLKTVLGAKGVAAPVLSFEEIGTDARPSLVGMVPA